MPLSNVCLPSAAEIGEADIAGILRMGTWRLAGTACPPIEALVSQVLVWGSGFVV